MRFSYVLALIISLSGCTSTSLSYQKKSIEIKGTQFDYDLKGETLYTTQTNLSQVWIDYHVFHTSDNENLVYEYARLNTAYKFKYNYPYILRQIFDAQDVKTTKDKDGLGFFTITLKDKTILYALAKTSTKKSLSLLYGFSQQNFEALMHNQPLMQMQTLQEAPKDAIKTQWNPKLIITGVLLEKVNAIPLR